MPECCTFCYLQANTCSNLTRNKCPVPGQNFHSNTLSTSPGTSVTILHSLMAPSSFLVKPITASGGLQANLYNKLPLFPPLHWPTNLQLNNASLSKDVAAGFQMPGLPHHACCSLNAKLKKEKKKEKAMQKGTGKGEAKETNSPGSTPHTSSGHNDNQSDNDKVSNAGCRCHGGPHGQSLLHCQGLPYIFDSPGCWGCEGSHGGDLQDQYQHWVWPFSWSSTP